MSLNAWLDIDAALLIISTGLAALTKLSHWSNAKFMGNGGQHGIATAAAAHLCKNYNTTPRGVYREHMRELQSLSASVTDTDCGAAAVKVLSAKL
ncbi:hypothetical protein LTR17_019935 [Elasticomyces elasticus]|nr:hypothetical protein LTR17_019935 [Elasticomyces elasticus]